MEIIRMPHIMRDTSRGHILHGRTIGFVPTMGAIHDGHLSLVRRAKEENNITVVSIFVNPMQFGPSEDFKQYPRDIEADREKLCKEKADILFVPDIPLMYREGFSTHVEVENISQRLCGIFRPGHFRGVATIVTKLLNIVKPTKAYFGQKDFQQTIVINQLVRDLDMAVDIVVSPTVRERDGLAISSRNAYLSKRQREAAPVIYKCLMGSSDLIKSGIIDAVYIKGIMQNKLLREPAVTGLDYAGVYDPATLIELSEIKGDALLAVAVKLGDTRLIDNVLVNAAKGR